MSGSKSTPSKIPLEIDPGLKTLPRTWLETPSVDLTIQRTVEKIFAKENKGTLSQENDLTLHALRTCSSPYRNKKELREGAIERAKDPAH